MVNKFIIVGGGENLKNGIVGDRKIYFRMSSLIKSFNKFN